MSITSANGENTSVTAATASRASSVRSMCESARDAQAGWSAFPLKHRLRLIRSFRRYIAEHPGELTASIDFPSRNGPAETIAAEIIPLADACRFLEKRAAKILKPRRLSKTGRPIWARGVSVEVHREPLGVVLIVGASNYPLFLCGVQAIQAIAAGNAVLLKPGTGSTRSAVALRRALLAAGCDPALVEVLPESVASVYEALEAGVDKVVMTGSASAGRKVLSAAADSLTPATMELSGCDAVFVLPGADLNRVARCVAFGLDFNGSATCTAPRRLFVMQEQRADLEASLKEAVGQLPVMHCRRLPDQVARLVDDSQVRGAELLLAGTDDADQSPPVVLTDTRPGMDLLRADLFAPVTSIVPVDSVEDALLANTACPYALGASIFGPDDQARALAEKVDAGCVVINDLIAPTADPRVPFGGRKQSGFGMTRGAAGLEAMTQLKAVIHQRGKWLPHLDESTPLDMEMLTELLRATHGKGWRQRLSSGWSLMKTARQQMKWRKENCSEQGPKHDQ